MRFFSEEGKNWSGSKYFTKLVKKMHEYHALKGQKRKRMKHSK